MQTARVSDILGIINKFAPLSRAESWDNPGLQVGNPSGPAERIMVSLDPCMEAVKAAAEAGCGLLVTHHPLIFSPLKKISLQDAVGGVVMEAIQQNLSVVAAHTNYDAADGGLNDLLAQRLGLLEMQPLGSGGWDKLVKLVVFTPADHEDAVRNAVFPFAVSLGKYDECSYMASGVGTFRPLAGSRPFCGEEGQRTFVAESRLEFLVKEDEAASALRAMRRAHPYEEPACDLYPLLNQGKPQGIGRWGNLPASLSLGDFASRVKEELGGAGIRVVGPLGRSVRKVAVCGGSGVFLLKEAAFKGVDVLVTGDIKYHEARNAEALGVALIDAGHFGTEKIAIDGLAQCLRDELAARGFDAEVLAFTGEQDPFICI